MLFEYDRHPGKKLWASWFLFLGGAVFLRPFFKVVVETVEESVRGGPILILPKHQSDFDVPLGYAVIKKYFRRHAWALIKASLARPAFLGFFWKIGGIPVERSDPKQSKALLVFAREVLYDRDLSGYGPGDGNAMVLFPEQHRVPNRMGEGKQAGFRFLVGKPKRPLPCYCVGYRYEKKFPRTVLTIRIGPARFFDAQTDPAVFLHERMREIAELSDLSYDFEAPRARR